MRGSPTPGAELMWAFAQRDPNAAAELYERLAPRVYGLGMVMLGSPQQAEDLVQDTFVKVCRKAETFDAARGSVETWVLLIARSLAIDCIRRKVLESKVLAGQEDPEASSEPGPEEYAETRDLADRARRAMAGLSAGQRAALELAYFGGKTSAEVAEVEGIPVGTAKTRIRTALVKLRQALEVRHDL